MASARDGEGESYEASVRKNFATIMGIDAADRSGLEFAELAGVATSEVPEWRYRRNKVVAVATPTGAQVPNPMTAFGDTDSFVLAGAGVVWHTTTPGLAFAATLSTGEFAHVLRTVERPGDATSIGCGAILAGQREYLPLTCVDQEAQGARKYHGTNPSPTWVASKSGPRGTVKFAADSDFAVFFKGLTDGDLAQIASSYKRVNAASFECPFVQGVYSQIECPLWKAFQVDVAKSVGATRFDQIRLTFYPIRAAGDETPWSCPFSMTVFGYKT